MNLQFSPPVETQNMRLDGFKGLNYVKAKSIYAR